jgi:hypothetical protein|tara:strand:- start:546 stop:689 length:144 start_codon:yes stop_codon:yes gene_type:complete
MGALAGTVWSIFAFQMASGKIKAFKRQSCITQSLGFFGAIFRLDGQA